MIAALYVAEGGAYYGIPDVDPWPEDRDARLYAGPWPVVAHPPCARWGRYWSGGPILAGTPRAKKLGDDEGCFEAALSSVRRWGGVLEHPEASHAWRRFGLVPPPRWGGWVAAGDWIGWTCCVEQGHYGHLSRKATWLYAAGIESLPSLRWGSSGQRMRMDDGYHSAEERRRAKKLGVVPHPRLSRRQRLATPVEFRDVLLDIARGSRNAWPASKTRENRF